MIKMKTVGSIIHAKAVFSICTRCDSCDGGSIRRVGMNKFIVLRLEQRADFPICKKIVGGQNGSGEGDPKNPAAHLLKRGINRQIRIVACNIDRISGLDEHRNMGHKENVDRRGYRCHKQDLHSISDSKIGAGVRNRAKRARSRCRWPLPLLPPVEMIILYLTLLEAFVLFVQHIIHEAALTTLQMQDIFLYSNYIKCISEKQ